MGNIKTAKFLTSQCLTAFPTLPLLLGISYLESVPYLEIQRKHQRMPTKCSLYRKILY